LAACKISIEELVSTNDNMQAYGILHHSFRQYKVAELSLKVLKNIVMKNRI
jgi:hypothetical protein